MIVVEIHDEALGKELIWRGTESQVRRIHNLVIRRLAMEVIKTGKVTSSGIYRAWQEPLIEESSNGNDARRKG